MRRDSGPKFSDVEVVTRHLESSEVDFDMALLPDNRHEPAVFHGLSHGVFVRNALEQIRQLALQSLWGRRDPQVPRWREVIIDSLVAIGMSVMGLVADDEPEVIELP